VKPRGIKITIDVDTSQAERARDILKEIVSIAKKAGLSKRWTRRLLKMQMTRDNGGYQPKHSIQSSPPDCGSSVQRDINKEYIITQPYVILHDAGFSKDQSLALARAILYENERQYNMRRPHPADV